MSTSITPPPPTGGNGKYIAVAAVMLIGMGGLIAWRVLTPPPAATTTPTIVISSAPPAPTPPRFDDIPPPPTEEDAGPDTGPPKVSGPALKPCEVTVCNGRKTEDMEAGLAMLARQTRKKCYEPALGQDPSLSGHVSIKLKIGGDGSICSATVGGADPGLQSVGDCTARLIQAAGRVAAPQGCVNIEFPLTYKPMGK